MNLAREWESLIRLEPGLRTNDSDRAPVAIAWLAGRVDPALISEASGSDDPERSLFDLCRGVVDAGLIRRAAMCG